MTTQNYLEKIKSRLYSFCCIICLFVYRKTDLAPYHDTVLQYNAWGKPTTKKSIQQAIAKMQQLRREVALDKTSIREMLEEGRRF